MPFVSTPVEIDGKRYLDGAISDSIPYEWMKKQGMDKIVVVLTQEESYVKKPFPKLLVNASLRKYPMAAKALNHRHIMYNEQAERVRAAGKNGEAFVILPSVPIHIKKLERDKDKLQATYDLGIKDATAVVHKLQAFIAE